MDKQQRIEELKVLIAKEKRIEELKTLIAKEKQTLGLKAEPKESSYTLRPHASMVGNAAKVTAKDLASAARTVGSSIAAAPLDLTQLPANLYAAYKAENGPKPYSTRLAETIDELTGGYTRPENPEGMGQQALELGSGLIGGAKFLNKGLTFAAKHAGKGARYLEKAAKANELSPKNIAMAAAGMTGAHTASKTFLPEEREKDSLANVLIPLGGAFVGGAGSTIRPSSVQRGLGKALRIDPKAVDVFKKAGINPTLGDVSNSKVIKTVENILGYTPGASGTIDKTRAAQRSQIANILHQGEEGTDIARASQLSHKGITGYKHTKAKEHNELFTKRDKDIESLADRTVMLDKTIDKYSDIIKNLSPQQIEKLPAVKQMKELMENVRGNKIDYFHAKQALKDIKDKVTTHGLIGNESQGQLKAIGKALDVDIKKSIGPKLKESSKEAYSNYKQANAKYSLFAEHDISKINDLLKSNKKGAVDSFLDLMRDQSKGGHKAKIVLEGLPEHQRAELIHSITGRLGEFKGEFSPTRWASNFRNLPKPTQALFHPYLGKEELNAVNKSIGHLKTTLAESNTSRSGQHLALIDLGKKLGKIVGGVSAVGLYGAVPVVTGLGSAYGASKVFTSPRLINYLGKGVKSKKNTGFKENLQESAIRAPFVTNKETKKRKYIIHPNGVETIEKHRKGDIIRHVEEIIEFKPVKMKRKKYAEGEQVTQADIDRQNKLGQEYREILALKDPEKYAQDLGIELDPENMSKLGQYEKNLAGSQAFLNKQQNLKKKLFKEYKEVDPEYAKEMRDKGYQGLVMSKPEDTEAGKLLATRQAAINQSANENSWKGKRGGGNTPAEREESLRKYQASLKKAKESGLSGPKTRDDKIALMNQKNQEAYRQSEEMKAAQYRDTMAAKAREQKFQTAQKSQQVRADMEDALRNAQESLNKDNSEYGKKRQEVYGAHLRELAKQQMDRQNEGFINKLKESGATQDANGNWEGPRENAWERLSSVPVLGGIVNGLDKISGGIIQSGANAGQQFGHGDVNGGISGLLDAGTKMAQFAANPGSALGNNIADYGMGKLMPMIMPNQEAESSDNQELMQEQMMRQMPQVQSFGSPYGSPYGSDNFGDEGNFDNSYDYQDQGHGQSYDPYGDNSYQGQRYDPYQNQEDNSYYGGQDYYPYKSGGAISKIKKRANLNWMKRHCI